MRFIVNSQVLLKNLQAVGGVVSTNTAVPILENYLFVLEGTELSIVGSDMETTIMVTITDIDSTEDGRIAIPSKMLTDVVKTFPDTPLVFQINNDNYGIEISCGTGKYKLVGEDPSAYPELSAPDENISKTELASEILATAISKTIFATGNDSLRQNMSGVYFEMTPDDMTFVATDAHKLVRYRRKDIKNVNSGNFIVPKKALIQIKNILSMRKDNVPVLMSYNEHNVFFSYERVSVICRLIEGKYPTYEAVIPKDNPNILKIERLSLLTAIKRIAIFAEQAVPQARFVLSGKELLLSAEDLAKANEAKERLECSYAGEPLDIAFNAKFMIEMLSNISTEYARIEMATPNRAGIIIPENPEDEAEDILMLVMPVNINR